MPTEPKCGPLTAAVISKQAEMLFGTTADMAIALRNHACRMEADRARLIRELQRLQRIVYVHQHGHAASILVMPAFRDGEDLLRDLGALK